MKRTLPFAILMCAALAACEPNTEASETIIQPTAMDAEAAADIETTDVTSITE